MMTLINGIEGALLAAGLYAIGVPNALLWGVLLMLLRFIPYLGVWVAALFPVLLAVAVFDGWTHMFMTVGLIVVLEVVTSQLIEPLLYGHHTGVSPLALLVAAVFWTWLWGPPGLFLAIPLTVTVVVLGKYLPQLSFIGVLMGDQPVLEPWERFYQRLLARAPDEADDVVEEMRDSSTAAEVADKVLLPALAMVERDHYRGVMSDEQRLALLAHIDGWVEDLFGNNGYEAAADDARTLCLPAQGRADEIGARLFCRVLQDAGTPARVLPLDFERASVSDAIAREQPHCVCVCTFPPAGIVNARRLCRRLHERAPSMLIFAALWNLPAVPDALERRFSAAGAQASFARLAEGLAAVRDAERDPRPERSAARV
jgi:hypothetical protein